MPKPKDEMIMPDTVLIEIPIVDVPSATWGLHVNTHLTLEQSHAIRRVAAALDRQLARLSNGRRVVNTNDALKYLLEHICVDYKAAEHKH